jgi:hypothetical protein
MIFFRGMRVTDILFDKNIYINEIRYVSDNYKIMTQKEE